MGILIREALAEDAGQLIRHLKEIGGESDNLSFGEGEFSAALEQEEMFLENLHNDKTSVFFVACKEDCRKWKLERNAAQNESSG